MKVVSFNINGIRAAINKGLCEWLEKESPDILCLQEIKATEDQIDLLTMNSLGYNYCYFHPAQKKGYSGVAILSKIEPDTVVVGMNMEKYDREGRVIRADFGTLSVVCVYIPSGVSGGERQVFKMEFLEDFSEFIANLQQERPELIICGDYNICHQPIDINHPERHINTSGFLEPEREWFDRFIDLGFIDTFREFNQEPGNYTWWNYWAHARARNLGWRIDYHLISQAARPRLLSAAIHPEVVYSDHCPVLIELCS